MTYSWNFQVMLLINNIFKQFVHRLTFRRCKMKKITFSPRHGAVDVLELSHLLMLHDGWYHLSVLPHEPHFNMSGSDSPVWTLSTSSVLILHHHWDPCPTGWSHAGCEGTAIFARHKHRVGLNKCWGQLACSSGCRSRCLVIYTIYADAVLLYIQSMLMLSCYIYNLCWCCLVIYTIYADALVFLFVATRYRGGGQRTGYRQRSWFSSSGTARGTYPSAPDWDNDQYTGGLSEEEQLRRAMGSSRQDNFQPPPGPGWKILPHLCCTFQGLQINVQRNRIFNTK